MNTTRQSIETLKAEAEDAGVLKTGRLAEVPTAPGKAVVAGIDAERAIVETPESAKTISTARIETAGRSGFALTRTDLERMMGLNDLVDEFYLVRALMAARPIMRVVLRSASGREIGYASGVMVSPRLFLTNHHVFPSAPEAENAVLDANFVNDIFGRPAVSYRFKVRPDLYFANNFELDWAIVAVDEASEDGVAALSDFGYHRLIDQTGKVQEGEFVTLIQHPSGQRRQFSIRENQFIKYFDNYLWYKCDTAPGSSGAPAFNDAFQIVGLHHAGVPEQDEAGLYVLTDGSKVGSLDGVAESAIRWIANAGIRTSRICESFENDLPKNHPFTEGLRVAMEGGDVMSQAPRPLLGPAHERTAPGPNEIGRPETIEGGIIVPLRLKVMLGLDGGAPTPKSAEPRASTAASAGMSATTITEKVPVVDRDYTGRQGFRTDFLGAEVPLPTLDDETFVSRMDDGSLVVPYQNFSVVLNKKRRMAYFTAANVRADKASRQPEAGRDYTRKGLAGLGKNDRETWIVDSRLAPGHQLPDRFYNNDRQSFDKGHIVQRDSVCWGADYATVQRANGDTYHVTNCSPQTSVYNQSSDGTDNWGDLENEIMKQSKAERLSVIAGPVFTDNDPVFNGKDDFGDVKILVPRSYWKVVVAEKDGQLEAFGFLLEQDMANVKFEFFVPTAWKKQAVRLSELQERIRPVRLPEDVIAADRFQN